MIITKMSRHFVPVVLTFITIRAKSCNWFKGGENIAVDPTTCRMETSATPHGINSCLDECDKNPECTGVAVESLRQSSWCCFFTENPIGVKSGSNVLIHKPEVQTGCLFWFDPETNCSQCLSSRRYDVIMTYISNGQSRSDVFINIVLSGDLCTQIGGNVQGFIGIVSGEIDRGNKTWTFEAANGTKFQATLLNGNMVNGIGHQPVDGAFTFTAVATG